MIVKYTKEFNNQGIINSSDDNFLFVEDVLKKLKNLLKVKKDATVISFKIVSKDFYFTMLELEVIEDE